MIHTYHLQNHEFTSADVAFVGECLAAYLARLPRSLRTGVPCPAEVLTGPFTARRGGNLWPLTVPTSLWDEPPTPQGLVVWRPIVLEPRLTGFGSSPPRQTPALFAVYWYTQRWPRLLIRHPELSFLLSCRGDDNTPALCAWQDGRWSNWETTQQTGYIAVGVAEDAQQVVCFDPHARLPDGDVPLVALPAELLFRQSSRLDRETLAAQARPLFPSFRALLEFCRDANPWSEHEPCPFQPQPVPATLAVPFNWEGWLEPEQAPDQPGRDYSRALPHSEALTDALKRIARKVETLRRADPGCLIPGSGDHGYRFNPVLLPEEQQAFEQAGKCVLPEAYARFLLWVGHGGTGPGGSLLRLEASLPPPGLPPRNQRRLDKPFPHRALWQPDSGMTSKARRHARQIHGTITLAHLEDVTAGLRGDLLLVIKGPERGHLWIDAREVGRPLYPIYRRGPLSFVAWYEQALDALLEHIGALYAPQSGGMSFQKLAQFTRLDLSTIPGTGPAPPRAEPAPVPAPKKSAPPPPVARSTSDVHHQPEALALLQAAADEPEDAGRRLVLADYLEEHGDAARASFIRAQVQQHLLPAHDPAHIELQRQERELLRVNRQNWLADFPAWARSLISFDRGLPGQIQLTGQHFLEHSEELNRITPFYSVKLSGTHGLWDRLAAIPALAQVRTLTLDRDGLGPDDFQALLRSPHLTRLRALDLGWNNLGAHGIAALVTSESLEQLRCLDVRRNELGIVGMRLLARWPRLRQLTELQLGFNNIPALGLDALLLSPHLGPLAALNLDSSSFGDEGIARLVSDPRLSQLQRLSLDHTDAGPRALQALAEATHLTQLGQLGLACNRIGAEGAEALAHAPHLGSINILDLHSNEVGPELGKQLGGSPHLRCLVDIDLDRNWLGDEGLTALASSAVLASVRTLGLWSNAFGDAGTIALAGSAHIGCLTKLDLSTNEITAKGMQALAGSALLKNLRVLELSGTSIGAAGVQALAESPYLTNLVELHLNWMPLGAKGARALARSQYLTQLEKLELDETKLGVPGIRALVGGAVLTQLKELNINNNRIGSDGLRTLAESPHLANLTRLDLGENRINAEGAAALAASPHLTQLQELDLAQNPLGDAGVQALAETPNLTQLRSLNLYSTGMGETAAQALLASPHLAGVTWLNVLDNPISPETVARLQERSVGG